MIEKTVENIKIADDPLEMFIDRKASFEKGAKTFTATLVAIRGDELYFKTKYGKIIMDRRSDITNMQVYVDEAVI